ncbi:MAG TPA: winged helix-turn-helix domain-containing protein [Spirochaetia bacterium]|nr:winged helix-turn-helix domain-containing protein [Spirochaetales bacterium]HRY79919.1 winged helix-turn-helix domain-containing protein [Spirochaetia bacterium]HRZ88866.1 winged helix-turn-helix domain-containing protein [Spirochaetia bacterium]
MPITPESAQIPAVEVRFSYTAELVLASMLVTGRPASITGFDEAWQKAQTAALPPAALRFLEKTRGFSCPTLSFIDFVARTREFDDPERLFAEVRRLPVRRFLSILLNEDLSDPDLDECLAEPRKAAYHVSKLSFFSRMPESDLVSIFTDPQAFREDLIGFVAANRTEGFEARIRDLAPVYAGRIAAMQTRLAAESPLQVIQDIKKHPPYRSESLRYVFLPSHFEGYMNISCHDEEQYMLLFTIVPPPPGDAAGIRIAEKLRALSDRSRMEVLRLLSTAPSYGKEISSRLGLTTATVSRHLDQLKKAGLVIEEPADAQNVKIVRLDRAGVEQLLDETRRFLFGESS